MKILVTGGAGFIGSHLVDGYRRQGHHVVVVDDLSAGRRENVPREVPFYQTSIEDPTLRGIIEKESPDVVNHHAAQIRVQTSIQDPVRDAEINILATLRLLETCRRASVKKIVFASSGGAIYGDQNYFPADEGHPEKPLNPYGIAKLTIEKYLRFYQGSWGIPFVALRYANVYGPRQDARGEGGVVAVFTERLLGGKPAVINGDGGQTRDYVYVEDVVQCNVAALNTEARGVFNVGTGVETDVLTIAQSLVRLTRSSSIPQHGPERMGDQRRSSVKPGALQTPPTPLALGLEKTVFWFKSIRK